MKDCKIIPEGMEECPVCEGQGEALFSCCTGDRVDEDFGRCPTCKEGLGASKCEDCNGTGLVKKEEKRLKVLVLDPIGAAELAVEAKRDWIAETYPTGPAWTGD